MAITTCCEVMDCVSINSSDNSVSIEKIDCGYDVKFSGNNMDSKLNIKAGECISFTKEFINGVLTLTPVLDFACIAAKVCPICNESAACAAAVGLTVTSV